MHVEVKDLHGGKYNPELVANTVHVFQSLSTLSKIADYNVSTKVNYDIHPLAAEVVTEFKKAHLQYIISDHHQSPENKKMLIVNVFDPKVGTSLWILKSQKG